MPAPPARMRSASVPCGLNSSSSSFARNCRSNSLVLADVRRHHLADLPRLEQQAEAEAIDAGVVGDDGEIARARVAQREDEILRNAAQAEAAGHHRHAVARQPGECGLRVGEDLFARLVRLHRAVSTDARRRMPTCGCSSPRSARAADNASTSTPKRCAANNCGTRQQSAMVGVSPCENLPRQMIALQVRVVGIESARDPFAQPGRDAGLVELQHFLEIHAWCWCSAAAGCRRR